MSLLSIFKGILPKKKEGASSLDNQEYVTKHFKWSEFACNDEGKTPVPEVYRDNVRELAKNLEIVRTELDRPIRINSGYRTIKKNRSVGGRSNSYHLRAMAVDIVIRGYSPLEVYNEMLILMNSGKIKQGGLGLYDTFVHYDIRGKKVLFDYRKKK